VGTLSMEISTCSTSLRLTVMEGPVREAIDCDGVVSIGKFHRPGRTHTLRADCARCGLPGWLTGIVPDV
jgi:hypothetical protein